MTSQMYIKVPNYHTDLSYGTPPGQRTVTELLNLGIINLDKPANPTSHEVTAWVKKVLNVRRAGHGGTLETLLYPGKSQGDRCSTHCSGRSYSHRSSPSLIGERIRLCHDASFASIRRQN